MLYITIPARELYNEATNTIVTTNDYKLQLEHSLVSLKKWEAKFMKPFISEEPKTKEETIEYIKCMTITQNVPDEAYNYLTMDNINQINAYIESPQTATTIKDINKSGKKEIITAEIIYYWMIANEIPPEYQKWHLNQLLTLIRVCSIKNAPPKKMSNKEVLAQNAALNKARRAAAARR